MFALDLPRTHVSNDKLEPQSLDITLFILFMALLVLKELIYDE